jgi:uncharacterized protein YjgD (DUF1641 family)
MAQPIHLELPPRDPRAELQIRLQGAPLEHAQALLAAYEVLQGLHDRGVFELLRGALGSSDKVIEIIVEAAKTPASIRSIRNGLILAKTLGTLEPEQVGALTRSLPEALALVQAQGPRPPGLWGILKRSRSPDFRRGLFLAASLLESLGRNLPAPAGGKKRTEDEV